MPIPHPARTDRSFHHQPLRDTSLYPPDTMLRLKEVCDIVGKKKSTLYKAITEGEFPAPKRIGKRAVGWSANIVFKWVAERPSTR